MAEMDALKIECLSLCNPPLTSRGNLRFILDMCIEMLFLLVLWVLTERILRLSVERPERV